MSEPTPEPPKRRRRWFSISLRALMIMVLIVGGVLGWRARRASIQRRSVAAIKEVGGVVRYDYQVTTRWPFEIGFTPGGSPPAPSWLRGPIGDEYFQEPTAVFLVAPTTPNMRMPDDSTLEAVARLDRVEELDSRHVPISEAGFTRLASMPRLRIVSLLDVAMTDSGLAELGTFPALETLRLRIKKDFPGISAEGLDHIARLRRLKLLAIMNTRLVNPSSLAPLAKLTRLEYLRLWKSPQEDACLEHLRGLVALKRLDLQETRLTDGGLDHLRGMDRLEGILMDGSKLTDAGVAKLSSKHPALKLLSLLPAPRLTDASLASLGRLRSIEYLILNGSDVTDAGLEHLRGLKLEVLSVSGKGVTDAGLAKLAARNQFTNLDFSGTSITGAGLATLSGQAKLQSLALDRSKVDDAGASILATIPSLVRLTLSETAITDVGLAMLQQMPGPSSLDIRGTKVTPQGLASYKKAKPGVMVDFGPVEPPPSGR